MHVCVHYTVLQRGHEPPTHRVRTRYLHRPGRPIHASTASSFRTALVERPTAVTTTYPLTVFPYRLSISAQYKKDTNYSKCIFRLASPTTSSTKKIDVPQNHESAHRPSLSLSLSLSAVLKRTEQPSQQAASPELCSREHHRF